MKAKPETSRNWFEDCGRESAVLTADVRGGVSLFYHVENRGGRGIGGRKST